MSLDDSESNQEDKIESAELDQDKGESTELNQDKGESPELHQEDKIESAELDQDKKEFTELDQDKGESPVKRTAPSGLIIGIIVAVGVAAFFAGSYSSSLNSDQISQQDLDEAMAKLELKILQNQLPTEQPKPPVKISADDDPIIGDPDAPIAIIEFSDFECPFCARFHVQTLPLLLEEYIDQGKVKLVFRDFPIQSIHPNAVPAAVAANCANDQGNFRDMHDMIFENQREWANQGTVEALTTFTQYAAEIQIDQEAFASCLTSNSHIQEIQKDLQDGRDYGVSGTPGFFIGNEQVGFVELKGAQPFESFKRVIDTQLGI